MKWSVLTGFLGLLLLGSCNRGAEYQASRCEGRLLPLRNPSGLYGYMDREKTLIVPYQFAYARPFDPETGLGGVNIGGTPRGAAIPQDGKWGFVNAQNQLAINPKYYSPPNGASPFDPASLALIMHEGYIFSEGLAAVRTEDEWIYIDPRDSVVIRNPKIRSARRFSCGLANVYINGRWGYIDRRGETVINPQYRFPANFVPVPMTQAEQDSLQAALRQGEAPAPRRGYALVTDRNGRRLLIDQQGSEALPQFRLQTNFSEGIAVHKARFKGENIRYSDEMKYGLVDTSGSVSFPAEFDRVGRYGNGLAPALVGSRPASLIVSEAGELTSPDAYIGGKWGFVDVTGHFHLNPKYDGAKGFSEGIGAVKQNGLWALINTQEGFFTSYEFRWVDYYQCGVIRVQLSSVHSDFDGRYAYVDDRGEVIAVDPD